MTSMQVSDGMRQSTSMSKLADSHRLRVLDVFQWETLHQSGVYELSLNEIAFLQDYR